ncbi:MAG: hypothetical protein AB7K24_33440, partial [Gemmataceae bacterium]
MLRTSLLFACVLFLPGLAWADEPEKLSDAEIKKRLIGKWEYSQRFGTTAIQTVELYKDDGTLEREDALNDKQKLKIKATWEVKDGKLTTVVTEGAIGKGTKVSGKILTIDDKSMQIQMDAGAKYTKTRVQAAQVEANDTRAHWVYEGGWFQRERDGTWSEHNAEAYRSGKPYRFKEVARTPEHVELHDAFRNASVRL